MIGSVQVEPSADGVVQAMVTNCHPLTQKIIEGTELGHAVPVELVNPEPDNEKPHFVSGAATEEECTHKEMHATLPTTRRISWYA